MVGRGEGGRGVSQLASSAFLASAAGTLPLQSLILRNSVAIDAIDADIDLVREHWRSLAGLSDVDCQPVGSQRVLDSTVVKHLYQSLSERQPSRYHKARLLAAAADHSGDWLHAIPISACGLRLSNESIRIAIGLRLGVEICQPFNCSCGTLVDALGSHSLSCIRNPGRAQRHHFLNDLIWRSLAKAGYHRSKNRKDYCARTARDQMV